MYGICTVTMDSLIYLLSDTARLLRRNFDTKVRRLGVTSVQARLLLGLAKTEGENQVYYADRLEVEPISLCRLVDRMEDAEMVERRRDPNDRRAWRLFLTDRSRSMIRQLNACIDEMDQDAVSGLSHEEYRELGQALAKMHASIAAPADQGSAANG